MARQATLFTIWLNGLENVDTLNCAVGGATGKLHLQVAKSNGTSMAARAKVVEAPTQGETIEIDVMTLDTLIEIGRPVAFEHLDVEGREWPVLMGARENITTHAPCIIVKAENWMRRKTETHFRELFPNAESRSVGCIVRNAIYVLQLEHAPFRSV